MKSILVLFKTTLMDQYCDELDKEIFVELAECFTVV
jgi:hypothetical protein